MTLHALLIQPFVEFGFMRRALVATLALGLACGPMGTLLVLAAIYRPLVVECFDPGFLRSVSRTGPWVHGVFLVLLVLNLVSGFQALGTLMAVGLMMLPAVAARFWASEVWSLAAVSSLFALLSGGCGLLLSYHANLPSGPAIVLLAGGIYAASLLLGRRDSLLAHVLANRSHRRA